MDWTGKVDSKASFALVIESALLVGIVAQSRKDGLLGHLNTHAERGWFWVGVIVLIFAVLCVITVVAPRLRGWWVGDEWRQNYIYFGHLRHWKEADLADALKGGDILPVLSRQLINMSKVAWRKHRRLQTSLAATVLGTVCIGIAAWLNRS